MTFGLWQAGGEMIVVIIIIPAGVGPARRAAVVQSPASSPCQQHWVVPSAARVCCGAVQPTAAVWQTRPDIQQGECCIGQGRYTTNEFFGAQGHTYSKVDVV